MNKTVRQEALEILKSNHFIIVSYQWRKLDIIKHWLDISIVTENATHIARFKHHDLRVHLTDSIWCKSEKVQSFLIIASDLPKFCSAMQWLFYSVPTSAKLMTHVQGTPPHDTLTQDFPGGHVIVRTKIQFQDQAISTETPATAKNLLLPFAYMIHGGQKVSVINTSDSLKSEVEALVTRMGPKIVWTTAMAWHMIESVTNLKSTADQLVQEDDLRRARTRYEVIWSTFKACPVFHLQDAAYALDPDLSLFAAYLCCTMLDAVTMNGFLNIRLGLTDEKSCMPLQEAFYTMFDFFGKVPDSTRKQLGQPPSSVLRAMHFAYFFPFCLTRTIESLHDTQRRMASLLPVLPHSEHLKHDFKMVNEIANSPGVSLSL